jgi:coenzyme F420-reducing hydrogenase alpha subunit
MPDTPSVPITPRAGIGHGATEAPRGICYHVYEIDGDGSILTARIVPPTSQNQLSIEEDLGEVATLNMTLPDDALRDRCEQTIRNYDPCISCSTHFLKLSVHRA